MHALINGYRNDEVKTMRQNPIKHITTIIKVNANGDTIRTNRVTYDIKTKRYFGDLIKENDNKTSRIYNECGYIDIFNGTFHYNFYVRDYIGSIRAVINQYGEIAQMADYYPCGIPTTEYNDLSQNDRLHTGKEFNAFNGYYIYDNAARYLDPILNRFTSIDPLAEKYPSFSPYTACLNNPIRYVDPDGRDTYYWDENGYLKRHRVDQENSTRFIAYDKEGQESNPLEFDYRLNIIHTQNKLNNNTFNADYYILNDEDATKKIFEFLANNTNVEWSEVFIQESESLQTGIISTSHKSDADASQAWVLENLGATYKISSATHNHTISANPSKEDIITQTKYENTRLNKNTPIMFYILFNNNRVPFPSIQKNNQQ